ncbi:MAG: hypothetical protein ACOCVL_03735 [Candidatus Sumerlaeota bacterium]
MVFDSYTQGCALGWYISGRWPSFKDVRFADFDGCFAIWSQKTFEKHYKQRKTGERR